MTEKNMREEEKNKSAKKGRVKVQKFSDDEEEGEKNKGMKKKKQENDKV